MTNSNPYQHILAAVDGSKITSKVLDSAIKAALRNNADLNILRIVQITQLTDGYSNASMNSEQTYSIVKTTKERLEDLQKKAEEAGVKNVSIHIRFGNPKRVIAREFPDDHQTDLIVMGATGVSGIERVVLGSVTHYVSRMAPCDVMVVRPNKEDK
ncbi:universal stress protein [Limosilactobacillus caccae]|jgi:nucleotide-binding universal stress UspA family protein|uniref:universal stress protein n=1 Tax=Limosilactobacillus caccae TaxID=1926284 RepID=UPI000970A11B|nr:universal stress protein [Limosilactobacillus caccae]